MDKVESNRKKSLKELYCDVLLLVTCQEEMSSWLKELFKPSNSLVFRITEHHGYRTIKVEEQTNSY